MTTPLPGRPRHRAALAASASLVALWLAAAPAAAQQLCQTYTVKRGDSLSRIAAAAGVAGGYQVLYNANRDRLRDPNLIELGQRLRIPCADGTLPGAVPVTSVEPEAPKAGTVIETETAPVTIIETETASPPVTVIETETGASPTVIETEVAPDAVVETETAPEAVIETETAPEAVIETDSAPDAVIETETATADAGSEEVAAAGPVEPEEPAAGTAAASALPAVRFLTGGAYAPFTDPDLPRQGMFTELVTTALSLNPGAPDHSVSFVNDWGEHLTVLLPSGAFDMGFPWYLPDCSRVQNLSESNARRCTDYDASDPFYEAVVGYYALNDSPYATAADPEELMGARLCRPQGWFTFDLEARRLVEPNVTMLVPGTQIECMEALLAGEVDVATYDALPAEADIATLEIASRVTEISALAELATMHVFTPKTHPNGRAYLDLLNSGLEELRISGEWFEIVARHLAEHQRRSSN